VKRVVSETTDQTSSGINWKISIASPEFPLRGIIALQLVLDQQVKTWKDSGASVLYYSNLR
jgi:hypothetical protein